MAAYEVLQEALARQVIVAKEALQEIAALSEILSSWTFPGGVGHARSVEVAHGSMRDPEFIGD